MSHYKLLSEPLWIKRKYILFFYYAEQTLVEPLDIFIYFLQKAKGVLEFAENLKGCLSLGQWVYWCINKITPSPRGVNFFFYKTLSICKHCCWKRLSLWIYIYPHLLKQAWKGKSTLLYIQDNLRIKKKMCVFYNLELSMYKLFLDLQFIFEYGSLWIWHPCSKVSCPDAVLKKKKNHDQCHQTIRWRYLYILWIIWHI